MSNYIVSYDLNGPKPSHAEMDKHLESSGYAYGRVLETVWYIGTSSDIESVYNYIDQILSSNDRLLVVKATEAIWRNLLLNEESLQGAWQQNQ